MGVQVNWEFFRAQLPVDWRELAVERGLIREQPPQLNTKVTDIEPVLRLILHRAGLETSLKTTTGEAAATHMIDLSSVALHKWERKIGPYLAELTAKLCDAPTILSPWRWSGYDVFAIDASTVTRPGSEGTTARVHYVLRLSTLEFVRCVTTGEPGGETFRYHEDVAGPGQLWIADRVYTNSSGVAAIVNRGAAVLVRHNRITLPLYNTRGKSFDVLAKVRSLRKPGEIAEWPVWVYPENSDPIRGRLCALRLPDDKAEQARKHLHREYGAHVSEQSLEAAAWVMIFTTVPRSRMKAQCVLELYRLRWQVELEIKRDKSIGGLGRLPNFREDTIATWLQAKLLIQHVAKKIASLAEASPPSVIDWHVHAIGEELEIYRHRSPSTSSSAPRHTGMARNRSHLRNHPSRAGVRRAA